MTWPGRSCLQTLKAALIPLHMGMSFRNRSERAMARGDCSFRLAAYADLKCVDIPKYMRQTMLIDSPIHCLLVIKSLLAILSGVGCETHDAVHALYTRRFSMPPSLLNLFLRYLENQSNPRLIVPCEFVMISLVVSSAC